MSGVALFIDPVTRHFERDRLFEEQANPYGGDHILAPYVFLREWFSEHGVPVHTADLLEDGTVRAGCNVVVSLGMRQRWPRLAGRDDVVLAGFFALECPIVEPSLYTHLDEADRHFRRLFSFSDDEALRPFLRRPLHFERFRIPQSFDTVHPEQWARRGRKFLLMINANKRPRLQVNELYSERLRAVAHFERSGQIDLYGVNWDQPPFQLGQTWVPATLQRQVRRVQRLRQGLAPDPLLAAARRAWRGPVADKADTLAGYEFAICFENMILPGWITEKLFDCLFAGTIPVYLGAPDITSYVPPECFVDMREFGDYAQLEEHLHGLSPRQREAMREAGRAFVGSERYRPFTKHAFAELLGDLVEQDAGVTL